MTGHGTNGDRDRRELADLADRIADRRRRLRARHRRRSAVAGGLGLAFRMLTDLIVAAIAGLLAGYGLDALFGTAPWLTVVFTGFGLAAGVRNVLRLDSELARDAPGGADGEGCGNPSKDE